MFTIEQIKAAHRVVKSGADFPAYVQALIALGVLKYESFVCDGHAEYFGVDGYQVDSPAVYPSLTITTTADRTTCIERLTLHQHGGTDYFQFCRDMAAAGVEKWVMDMQAMTCIYYDTAGTELLSETIPGIS